MMNIKGFPMCAGCARKEKRDNLGRGKYYCSIAARFNPDGIVTDDVDATYCVQEGWYRRTLP